MTSVLFLDLAATNDVVRQDVLRDLDVLAGASSFTLGGTVTAFEEAWADYCGAKYCVAVGSGTDALTLALKAQRVADTQMIVPAMTFQATWEAVTHAGARPRPIDVDPSTYMIHSDPVADYWANGTVGVDLYGHPLTAPATLVDASQSHGVRHAGVTTTYSFFPTKNLGAWGDAGAVVTDDEGLADEVRALRTHGGTRRGQHDRIGFTSRMDAVQAAVLLRKLPYLDEWNELRRQAAAFYLNELHGSVLVLPSWHDDHVWHLFVVRSSRRDELAAHLAEHGIETAVHYPKPPHLTRAYAHLGYQGGDFPVAESLASDGLSLPLWPGITWEQQAYVVDTIHRFYA